MLRVRSLKAELVVRRDAIDFLQDLRSGCPGFPGSTEALAALAEIKGLGLRV